MKSKFYLALTCAALVALSLPAMAYVIQAENIPTSSDWSLRTLDTALPCDAVTGIVGASNGAALNVVDDDSTALDVHAVGNTADILYTYASPEAFNGTATAVVRMKTTSDYAFSDLTGTSVPPDDNWERNIILSFTDATQSFRKCAGLAIRPDGVAFTNTTATTLYPAGTVYAIDNTVWHTYTIVGHDFTGSGGTVELYVDGGTTAVLSSFINGTTDTAIGLIDALSIGGATGGTGRDGTGSWMFDFVGVKAGADASWSPTVPEPGSLLAFATGLIGLLGFGIRRRK